MRFVVAVPAMFSLTGCFLPSSTSRSWFEPPPEPQPVEVMAPAPSTAVITQPLPASISPAARDVASGSAVEVAPSVGQTPTVEAVPIARPAPAASSASRPPTFETGGAYYEDCSAARAVGLAPVYAGEPGYRPALDPDGDGVACD